MRQVGARSHIRTDMPFCRKIASATVTAKDIVMKSKGADYEWVAMGRGIVDWLGQFKALKRDGYRNAVSLETHWRGAGTPEESTRQSWARMKHILEKAEAL
jgi:sugar phosphate isomerase/epimerase